VQSKKKKEKSVTGCQRSAFSLQPKRAKRKMIFLLSYTKLRKKRTEQVGQMSLKQAIGYGL
jgi:hypothetical protein